MDAEGGGGVLVSCLFLHHFEDEALSRLGNLASGYELMIFVEPLRTRSSMLMGKGMLPFVNRVTRHDLQASIRAGFLPGELPLLMGLTGCGWKVSERCSWRGAIRVLVSRDQ